MIWNLGRGRSLDCRNPQIMGVLNVTPDSFSDGGRYLDPARALDRAEAMVAEGATMIDVGGESTRPQAPEISVAEECRRVLPVIEKLRERLDVPISIDTRKAEVAKLAVENGATIVNDVAAASRNSAMLDVVKASGCGYVAMHMQGTPQSMQTAPTYRNVVEEVGQCFESWLRHYAAIGIEKEQIVLDVGIGFGKTVPHNLLLMRELENYNKHGRPILLGASRKSFIGKVLGLGLATDRLAGSLACVAWGLKSGVTLFRVHDVRETSHLIRVWGAIEAGL